MVAIRGWLEGIRIPSSIGFITIRSPSREEGFKRTQLVLKDPELHKVIEAFGREDYVEVQGDAVEQDLVLRKITLVHKNEEGLPVHLGKKNSLQANQSLKGDRMMGIELAKGRVLRAIREYLCQEGFVEHPCQKLLTGATEGGSEVFRTCDQKFLAQSPQLQKQLVVNSGMMKMYDIGNVFRAEKFKTSRHSQEYTSIDLEMNVTGLEAVINASIGVIIAAFSGLDKIITEKDFARVDYTQAIQLLQTDRLDREGEVKLFDYFSEKFIVVTGYPEDQRAFYTDGRSNFDILCRESELCSGSLRIPSYERLVAKCDALRIDISTPTMKKYLDSFKSGSPTTGGSWIGFDRLIATVLGLGNICQTHGYRVD